MTAATVLGVNRSTSKFGPGVLGIGFVLNCCPNMNVVVMKLTRASLAAQFASRILQRALTHGIRCE